MGLVLRQLKAYPFCKFSGWGWQVAFFSDRTDALKLCFYICAEEYCFDFDAKGEPTDVGFPFMVGAFTVFQTIVGEQVRQRMVGLAEHWIAPSADKLPDDQKHFALARLHILKQELAEAKTGIWASMKTKSLLEKIAPEILNAIEKYDPSRIPRPSKLRRPIATQQPLHEQKVPEPNDEEQRRQIAKYEQAMREKRAREGRSL